MHGRPANKESKSSIETLDGRHRDGDTTLKYRTRKTEGRGTRAEAELDAALHYRSDRSTAYAVPQQ
jgi:hypothetical protein